jgi:hypothetical protein
MQLLSWQLPRWRTCTAAQTAQMRSLGLLGWALWAASAQQQTAGRMMMAPAACCAHQYLVRVRVSCEVVLRRQILLLCVLLPVVMLEVL